jgi:hypothetical protein
LGFSCSRGTGNHERTLGMPGSAYAELVDIGNNPPIELDPNEPLLAARWSARSHMGSTCH